MVKPIFSTSYEKQNKQLSGSSIARTPQASKKQSFVTIAKSYKPLTVVEKLCNLDVCRGRVLATPLNIPDSALLAGIYLLKVNNRNTRTRCKICSKLTLKTPEWRYWHRSGVFIVNFIVIFVNVVFVLLNLNMWLPAGLWL